MHAPEVLILDEPASGLDPEARHVLARLFTRLQSEGMTLIVSSHILAELDEYSTHMLVLRSGKVIENRPLGGTTMAGSRIRVELATPVAGGHEPARQCGAGRFLGAPATACVRLFGPRA